MTRKHVSYNDTSCHGTIESLKDQMRLKESSVKQAIENKIFQS